MRKHYDLSSGGRPNPYYAKLGAEGRKALAEWRAATKNLVRLDDDVFAAFPGEASVNEALRLVIKLAALVKPKSRTRPARKPTPKARKRKAT
jgi:hypothetical protein